MRLPKEYIKEAAATIFAALCDGKNDKEVIDEMGLSAEQYEQLKAAMFDSKADEVRTRPTEHVYVEYLINQINNINDLTQMIELFKTTKQFNAMVGAVRARSEIYDKLIARGQEFNLIHKRPDRKEIVAGVMIGDLTNKDLKKLITGELGKLNKMMKRYGDKEMMAIEPGPIYMGPSSEETAKEISAKDRIRTKLGIEAKKTSKPKIKRTAGKRMLNMKPKDIKGTEGTND